ncbi:leucine-rich repeat receptor protein kinase [Seminavis robusta]|uniref:Leucine-rich repeat receptor protein kinase n=1 Tax=Seminavis robusta TaxID=568900 RepID=A0A9N8ET74_9STRA|nr:leucine-rich repeat receptor protein kinase [Seminavis robusta]|eukprot:Sro1895_g304000.1 leucine-rich repeat receptor protein kinase (718) ;mRNA; f:13221-15475
MPRFSKPAVEDESGELIMPGAMDVVPGVNPGDPPIIERRSTFEWDNNDRALINVDELSVALSDDEEHQSEIGPSEQEESKPMTADNGSDNQETPADVEQGFNQQLPPPQRQTSGESQPSQSTEIPVVPINAPVVVASEQTGNRSSSLASEVFVCAKAPTVRATWIRAIIISSLVLVGMGMIILTQRRDKKDPELVAVVGTPATDSESFAPPTSELAYRSDLGLQPAVAKVVDGTNKLQPNWSSPYYQALYWILYEDPLQLTLEDDDEAAVQQRFLMSAFYFATSTAIRARRDLQGHDSSDVRQRPVRRSFWKHCGAPSMTVAQSSQSDMNATLNDNTPAQPCTHQELIQESPKKFRGQRSWRWLSATHECDWAGVECNEDDRVTSIVLADYGLNGRLIEELGFLESLETLSLPYNDNLVGEVPARLVGQVQVLELHHNQHDSLSLMDQGSQDSWLSNSPLQVLRMAGNKLSGSIFEELGQLSDLRVLSLEENSLTGTLPPVQWPRLNVLRLNQNRLSGSIPSSILSASPSLQILDLSRNAEMTGRIPSEIGTASPAMEYLRLAHCQFEGTLPIELYDLAQLVGIDLQGNNLQGTMATEIGQLIHLAELNLQNNHFEGNLPTQLGNLNKISDFRINGNDFEGDIPVEFCDLGIQDLPLAYSAKVVADCSQEDEDPVSSAYNPLHCPEGCCSTCCEKSTEKCTLNPFSILGIRSGGNTP